MLNAEFYGNLKLVGHVGTMLCLNFLPTAYFFTFLLLSSADFLNSTYSTNYFMNTIRVSNSLDPDQTRHFVGSDLVLNCLQRFTADDTSRQRVLKCAC